LSTDRGVGRSPLVLVVDDDAQLLALLSGALHAAGYAVRLATSAPMAIELLRENERAPDLIMVDMHMPQMSGLQLLQAAAAAHLPFLMMSASGGASFVQRAVAQGAVGYLVKPLELNQLIPAVMTAIARGREIVALRENARRLTATLQENRETAMAVGVLMERHGVSGEAALARMRQHAAAAGQVLPEVAAEVLRHT
jgi:response regulator NasT